MGEGAGIGHNGGPPLDHVPPWGTNGIKTFAAWRIAHRHRRAVSPTVARHRQARAERLGLTYDEYAREIAERGRHLSEADAARIREIIAGRRPPA